MKATSSRTSRTAEPRGRTCRRALPGAGLLAASVLLAAAPASHADSVTTYGVGLTSCQTYLNTLNGSDAVERVTFVDWLSGYVSAVNRTSHHRNNFLGLDDLGEALRHIEIYCQARPLAPFALAASHIVYGAHTGPAAHRPEPVSYGSADKTCARYLQARESRDDINGAEFRDWLAGYLSGVNAMSLASSNVLGNSELLDAVQWLDEWCSAHPAASYISAAEALVTAHDRETPVPPQAATH